MKIKSRDTPVHWYSKNVPYLKKKSNEKTNSFRFFFKDFFDTTNPALTVETIEREVDNWLGVFKVSTSSKFHTENLPIPSPNLKVVLARSEHHFNTISFVIIFKLNYESSFRIANIELALE